jgi:hypothetical protein
MNVKPWCIFGICILLLGTTLTVSAQETIPYNCHSFLVTEKPQQIHIGQKIEAIMNLVNETLIRECLETLVSYAPRRTSTYGCIKSAEYLYNKLATMNVTTSVQNWTAFGNQYNPQTFQSQNIEATIPGTNDESTMIITFTAHYDSATYKEYKKQGLFSPGADDDASGVAAVIAAAYALSHFTFEHTIKFITFAGEEVGLLGSRTYTHEAHEKHKTILINLNADMIGYAPSAEDGRKLKMFGSEDAGWAMDVIETINQEYSCGFEFFRGSIPEIGTGWLADCHSFMNYGYETVTFFEGGNYPYAHTPFDVLENINISYLVKTTRLFAATLAYLADNDSTYPQVRIASPMRGKIYKGETILHTFSYEKPTVKFLNEFYRKASASYSPTIIIDNSLIWIEAIPGNTSLLFAEFYYDNNLAYVDTEPPFHWNLNKRSLRNHKITVVVYDEQGRTAQDSMIIRFINPRIR